MFENSSWENKRMIYGIIKEIIVFVLPNTNIFLVQKEVLHRYESLYVEFT